ncbi:hypothetical protein CCHR01_18181 [Colletotrichum chrysophilum]|uniref:NB-ARC domain-containing protein n=1 Tax=Colletotrichum chrysophilum TaxID=1836956 RepID=A0AAD9A0J1_9PEZI|nr:hypothetical protein CCHR01_18181 [Colletotrichum chrysophilum]
MVRGPKNCNFVGRSEILDRLKEEFGHGARCKVFGGRSRACLYGLGGVGKTQIALQYVYWLHETRPDFSIFWVHASSEARFRQSFEDIAEECDIPGRHAPSVNVLSLVQTWLRQQLRHPWLLVLDNADDEFLFYPKSPSSAGSFATKYEKGNGKQGLGHFIPECGQGCVLVTTRNKQAGLDLVFGQPIIEVERMDDEESARMISAMTGAKDLLFSKSSTLSNRLENLPLALAQASAFISRNSITVDRYLELLDKSDRNFVSLLCQDFTAVGRDSEIPPAVMLTWVVSFEQIDLQYPLASELLSLMAFFDCQTVPKSIFSMYFSGSYLRLLKFQYSKGIAIAGGLHDEEKESDTEIGPPEVADGRQATSKRAHGLLHHLRSIVKIQAAQSITEKTEEKHQESADWYPSLKSGTSETASNSKSGDISENLASEELHNREEADSVEIEKALGVLKAF